MNAGGSNSMSKSCTWNCSTVSCAAGVARNSAIRFCNVSPEMRNNLAISPWLLWNPWQRDAISNETAHTPSGRRPSVIQSFFNRVTMRSAVVITVPTLSPKSNRAANRWMYKDGSTNGSWMLMQRENCRNALPSTYTLICNASEKSMSKWGLFSLRHTVYRHVATT